MKKNFRILFLGITVTMALASCRDEERASPDETYRAYYAKVIAGRSFDEDVEYHAKLRRPEVQEGLQTRAANSSQTIEEIETLYLNFTQQLAECGSLTLSEEKVDGDTASLIYAVTDTCTENQNTQLYVEMVYERGWKIQSDELRITNN
ncbi:MAG: hypothetical protein KUG69_09225 [Marinosulfonomonas sp.]|nr:hypothetical protein [Marinosulfonomonas sp.]